MRIRFGIVGMTVSTVLAAILVGGCTLLPEERVEVLPTLIEPPPSRTVTYPVERKRIVEEIRGLARVAPTLETNMYFKQSGRVATVNVQPGQQVKKGDLLIQLETGSLEHDIKLAEIDLEMAELSYERTRASGAPFDIRMQELSLEKTRLRLENLYERLEAATIRAPHDGIVQNLRARVGELVQEYNTVLVVADPASQELQVEMRRTDELNKIARGQKALVEVSRDTWAPATVVQISQISEDRLAGSIVHIELDEGLGSTNLRLGDLVSVRIIVREKEDALVIPRAALREFMGRRYVRVLDGDTRREVDVDVGIMSPTEVEILAGLSEGDIVIGQ